LRYRLRRSCHPSFVNNHICWSSFCKIQKHVTCWQRLATDVTQRFSRSHRAFLQNGCVQMNGPQSTPNVPLNW
jgi:hypothetical protein